MTNKIVNYRNAAAQCQKWLCHYCDLPMGGKGSPYATDIPLKKKYLLVTAEHLHARQDGGADTKDNIVVAHAICNRRRHKSGLPKSPATLANHVKSLLAKNRWFSSGDLKLLTEAREAKLVHGTEFPGTTGQHSPLRHSSPRHFAPTSRGGEIWGRGTRALENFPMRS